MKTIFIACGSGTITSVMASEKLKSRLKSRNLWPQKVKIYTGKVEEILAAAQQEQYDLIITTASLDHLSPVKVINGAPLLTGKGIQTMIQDVITLLGLSED